MRQAESELAGLKATGYFKCECNRCNRGAAPIKPDRTQLVIGCDAATDAFAHDTAFVDRKTSRLNFVDLVVRVLIDCTNSCIDKGARHMDGEISTKWKY